MSFLHDYYIQPKNQQLIWNTVSNMELFKRCIQIIPQFEILCSETFKGLIEKNYTNLKPQNLPYNPSLLQHTNRETLRDIVEVIQNYLKRQQQPLQQQPLQQQPLQQMVVPPPTLNDIYESRKTEYSYSKPAIPDKNPFELEKDEPITNIDELIEKHRREREDSPLPPQPIVEMTDNKFLLDIQRQLGDLRNEIAQLKKEIESMKRSAV